MGVIRTVTRRTFLVGTAAVTGGAAFGIHTLNQPFPNPLETNLKDEEAALTQFVLVNADGVTIVTPKGEMGQGVQSTWAALVAEEMDLNWADVKIEHGPPSKAYYNEAILEEGLPFSSLDDGMVPNLLRSNIVPLVAKIMTMQVTGGSSATADGFDKMRVAGATAREALKLAASKRLGTKVSNLTTANGHVIFGETKLSYASLAADAAKVKLPKAVKLKPQSEWKLLGKSLPRLDMKAKVTGTADFAPDLRFEGMKFATVKRNPHLGAAMNSFDDSAALAVNGVEKTVPLVDGLIVIADNTWTAFKAANLITFDWAKAEYPDNTEGHYDVVRAAFDKKVDSQSLDKGNVEKALEEAEGTIEAEYKAPYLAHACMEPVNATALLSNGRLDVWCGNQDPLSAQAAAANAAGLTPENVHIHTQFMGGGFGRKSEIDFTEVATHAAMAMEGTPVQVMWSREEDMTHDFYRPIAMGRFKAALQDGKPHAFDLKVACPSIMDSGAQRGGPALPGPDITSAMTIWDQPYDIPNYRASAYRADALLPIGSWRSVGGTQNAFFHESMVDELAHHGNLDPMAMRLDMMNNDVCKTVLTSVKAMSGWGRKLPNDHAMGCAFVLSFGVPTAEVIEIQQTPAGIKVINVWIAADVGIALDPGNIEAQIFGGLNYGLAAAMMGEINVKDGKVVQTNFHDYDGLRLYQAPKVEIKILENGKHIRGIGEPGTPPAAPALGNAIFALTGKRLREMPFNKFVQFA